MKIASLNERGIEEIVKFWNRNIGNEFPMAIELFKQNSLNNKFVCQESSRIVLNEENEVIGLIIAKRDTEQRVSPTGEKTGWIQVILVDKTARKQGIGSKLLEHVEKTFERHGIQNIYVGRDPYHYFPGIPAEYQRVIDWFEKKSYKNNEAEYDLINKYLATEHAEMPVFKDVEFTLLNSADRNEMVSFMEREFTKRWLFELNEYFDAGGKGREFVIIKEKEKIVGFCRINDKESPIIASNIYWSPLINEDLGGVGPLGIAADKRGLGYGLAIVKAGIAFLRERNINTIVIDWTGLVDFYKKLSYQPWKKYIGYSKKL